MKLLLPIAILLTATCTCSAWGQSKYSLREDWGSGTGSHVIAKSPLPFNKNYDELTTEQKATLRADYVKLGENDEPPYPLVGKGNLTREIAKIQQLALIEGELSLTAQIDQNGDAQSVAILKTPDGNVSQAVAYAIMRTKFKPGKCEGKPCSMEFPLIVTFRVANR